MKFSKKFSKCLLPLDGRIIKKDFIGFDVETFGEMNTFRLCSFVFGYKEESHKEVETFFSKYEALDFIYKHKRLFQGKCIVATNLQFDLTALFFDTKYWNDLKLCWSNSNLISAQIRFPDSNKHGFISFIDTLNFNRISVKEIGKIIGIEKMEIDKYLFDKEKLTNDELKYMIEYNINDAKISQQYMYHIQKTINDLGGNVKLTAPSSALDLFRRKFQKQCFIKEEKTLNDKTITEFIHKSYFGGRTENFNVGEFENTFYYDVNSLYPFSMLNYFPFPNSVERGETSNNNVVVALENINNYMGISEVDVIAPNINIPFLPYRGKEKTIYPVGKMHGVWTHALLKESLNYGYKIHYVYKQIIYKNCFEVFKEYVTQLYDMRKKLKAEGNVEEQTIKMLMNSLYGKFAQRPSKLYETFTTKDMTADLLLKKLKQHYQINQNSNKSLYIMTKESKRYPKNSFPILSTYVTSYAMIHMYKILSTYKPIYTDTDSIITQIKMPDDNVGLNLGQVKIEKTGTVNVQGPKCYAFNKHPTIKGIKIDKTLDVNRQYDIFIKYLNGSDIQQNGFCKLKSGIKLIKGRQPNQRIEFIKKKNLNTISDKRLFDINGNSNPIEINDFYVGLYE